MSEHRISLEQLSKVKDGSGHSIFGASGSPMYLACPGSLIPNILATDDSGYDAAYGTVAHGVTEEWLRTGRRPDGLIGKREFVGDDIETWHVVTIDDEMLDYAEMCVDRCEWEPGDHFVETHVDFSHLTPIPNQGGTLDFAALRPRRATVVDHKFGASPENIVYAEENPQLMLYTIGLWRDPRFEHYAFDDFIIRINQPRLDHFDEWHTTARRLAEFEDYCRERMALAWQWDAPRVPGPKQCRFCKVRATCVANAKLQEDLISSVFVDETVQTAEDMRGFVARLDDETQAFSMRKHPVADLTTAHLAKLITFRGMAESWWKAAGLELNRRAHRGEQIPGMKVVEGRTRRVFRNEAKTIERLTEHGLKLSDVQETKLISPSKAEKMLRTKAGLAKSEIPEVLRGLVFKPPGKATLVPTTDRRPEVVDVAALAFEDESDAESETED
jgi:hypothetical protein